MKKIINTFIITSLVFGAIISGILIDRTAQPVKADLGGNINTLPYYSFKYATTTLSNNGATLVLASSTARLYASISNISSYPVALYFYNSSSSIPDYANQFPASNTSCGFALCNVTAVAPSGGLFLNASSTYEIKLDNLYQGAVYGISVYGGVTPIVSVMANQ